MKIKDILAVKGAKVWTIGADHSIRDAMQVMFAEHIGSLVVTGPQTHNVAGIISERDIVRGFHSRGSGWEKMQVADLMTRKIVICDPEDSIEDIMAAMTERRIRHVPVMEDGQLKGMISIGDVVKALLKTSEHEIRFLKEYMYGPLLEEG